MKLKLAFLFLLFALVTLGFADLGRAQQSGRDVTSRYSVGLVAGDPDGTEFTIAHELSAVLGTGQETGPSGEALRIVPIAGKGGLQNVRDVLFLRGVDMGIAETHLLDRLQETKELGEIASKLVYITRLFDTELHVLARPEIRSIADLAGQAVNFGYEGSGNETIAREVFELLGIQGKPISIGQKDALERMRKGEVAATVIVTGKPAGLLGRASGENGFHLLPVSFGPKFQKDYRHAVLTHEDYPNLIPPGERIATLATGTALIAVNWPKGSDRYHLLEGFTELFFARLSEFQQPPRHPKWQEVDLATVLPGWRRFEPAERWLEREHGGVAASQERSKLRAEFEQFLDQTGSVRAPGSERERMFREFLRWRERARGR
jgi:uncharacterized protein